VNRAGLARLVVEPLEAEPGATDKYGASVITPQRGVNLRKCIFTTCQTG
jgi:hypothetical protein